MKTQQHILEKTCSHLSTNAWKITNRALVGKAISEFAHELLLIPELKQCDNNKSYYQLVTDSSEFTYQFEAQKQALDHWAIDLKTIVKKKGEINKTVDALLFILEFKKALEIPESMLPTYLEEISSTISGAIYKYKNEQFTAKELTKADFQEVELAMTEGHPCFVANNGRIGFNAKEYLQYAPEANNPFQLIWLAGHKKKTTFSTIEGLTYNTLIHQEIGINTIAKFHKKLDALGLDFTSYIFIPIHPWQWYNKLVHIFAADIAKQDLVFLGLGGDLYSAQQSIRTLYNKSNPNKFYTKTALSILNMGFMRGLSPYYMQSTPAITQWITKLVENDSYLKKLGFTMLGEIATVGYRNQYFESLGKSNALNKMLSALWRESPHSKVTNDQKLMTMASFLHIDSQGNSFLKELIKASSYTVKNWVNKYLEAYLKPLLHCFYTYEMVFMPHGENLIMVMKNHTPVKVLMKDITEEVIVFNKDLKLPEQVQRLYTKTTDKMKVLAIFTDIFDCFFRFMSSILSEHLDYNQADFWELVATNIYEYQAEHPQLADKFKQYDLFISKFDRCCLNRLQLRNTKQMLDLADPIESLQLVGTLQNPLAKYGKLWKLKKPPFNNPTIK